MGRRNKCKPRLIPQQDKRICGSICFCQLVVVFSSVSLIYLTVAVYIPSYKAFNSGFETTPVMCQTINTSMLNNCSWASCGEWCLTKTSGFCPQIHVTVRQNGTQLQLLNCTKFSSVSCPDVSTDNLRKYNCNNGTQCSALSGVFNCSLGHCRNMSEIFQCHYKADGPVLDSDKENMKLTGNFECRGSKCTKIKKFINCDRYCDPLNTTSNNVYITMDDTVHMARCSRAMSHSVANGDEPGKPISPIQVWTQQPDKVLMISCLTITYNDSTINGTDCLNGTIFNITQIPKVSMNFTTFYKIRDKWNKEVDPQHQYIPIQSALTIYNHSRLYINLDGCVNTLRGECRDFLLSNGRDGSNKTAQSRFPCYYNKNNSFMVVARYDLNKTWKQLIIAMSVPSVLFVISFLTLCIIMQSVKVGDDTKMRCKYCLGNTEPDSTDMTTSNSKYEVPSPMDGPSRKSEKSDTSLLRP